MKLAPTAAAALATAALASAALAGRADSSAPQAANPAPAARAPALPAAPDVDARAYLVYSASTGEPLLQHAERHRVPMASITKLMTVLVALRRARLGELVTVGDEAAAVGESTVELQPGEHLTVRDLVKAALIQSANDAAAALAEHVADGDTERFVALMNQEARRLRLRDTHFVRPDGLDVPGHFSSARDVTRLAQVAMRLAPVRQIVRRRSDAIAGGRRLATWNDLLASFPGTIGVKTGHTSAAGWCEVAATRRGGVTIYATILGSPSREQRNRDLAELLRFGLARVRAVPVVHGGATYASAATAYGKGSVQLVAARTVAPPVRVDRPLVERVVAPASVSLPVERGERLGVVSVYRGRRLIATTPLVAARSVSRPNVAERIGWYAGETVANAWGWVT